MERKRINTNPRRGFKHALAPSRMFWKNIRGMLPHKEARGAAALASLRLFDGIPYPYDQKKRMVCPDALKVLRMKTSRNFTVLKDIAGIAGWTRSSLIDTLEDKRKAKSAKFYEASQAKAAARAAASGDKSVAAFNGALTKLGF
jgi:large subunit ribosomal protein L13Ae